MAICASPRMGFGLVDVRDVADLHLRAMTDPKAKGERFLAVAGEPLWMIDVARVLRQKFGAAAAAAPRREIPNWVVRLLAPFVPMLRQIVPQLGICVAPRTKRPARCSAGRHGRMRRSLWLLVRL